jgi:hypothetical protein
LNANFKTSWFILLVSFFPGLGIIFLEKRKLGFTLILIVTLLFCVFLLIPNFITWFIFSVVFIAQMAYAVALATFRSTKVDMKENSNLAKPLPAKFTNRKDIESEIEKSFFTLLGNDEKLISGIIGLKKNTSQFMLVGVTQEHLLFAYYTQFGNLSSVERILKDDVSWVNLVIGERSLFLTIEYESENKLILQIAGGLQKQAKLIADEFPGTWSNESDNFVDRMLTFQKETNRLSSYIVYIICIVIMAIAYILSNGLNQPNKSVLIYLSFSVAFFIMGWPQFISYLKQLKKEPGLTSVNVIASFSVLSSLVFWSISIYNMGVMTISLAKYLHTLKYI